MAAPLGKRTSSVVNPWALKWTRSCATKSGGNDSEGTKPIFTTDCAETERMVPRKVVTIKNTPSKSVRSLIGTVMPAPDRSRGQAPAGIQTLFENSLDSRASTALRTCFRGNDVIKSTDG